MFAPSKHNPLASAGSVRTVLATLFVFAAAQAAHSSILSGSLDGVGAFDASVRVEMNTGLGTGTIFARGLSGNILTLCIVTADHVTTGGVLDDIGIRGNMNGGFNVIPYYTTIIGRGPTGKEDMSFIGATINLATDGLTAAQNAVLSGITPVNLAPATDLALTAHGYGVTAAPATAGEQAAYGLTANGYVHHDANAAENYGTERNYTGAITFGAIVNSAPYNYGALGYKFQNNGDGYGLGGDSGEGWIFGGNTLEDVFTLSDGLPVPLGCQNDMPPTCTGEAIDAGFNAEALALTQNDVNWLKSQPKTPEPATSGEILAGLAALFGIARGRNRRRKQAARVR